MNKVQPSTNFDRAELDKFAQLASRWWDAESEFKPLHDINPLRLDYIDKHAPLKGGKVLDVGCGGGILSEAMALAGANVTGIDMAQAPLSVARLHAMESGIEVDYRQISAEDLAREAVGEYDIVTCLEMLEHVPDPASSINACAQLVKPGGAVFFSTINRNPKAWLLAVVGAEYVLRLLPKGTHDYARFIRPSELNRWCGQAGLQVEHMTGMHYNPLSRQYRLGSGVDVNYLVYTRKMDHA